MLQCLRIVARHDLDEFAQRGLPVIQQGARPGRSGVQVVAFQEDAQAFRIVAQVIAHAVVIDALRALLRTARAILCIRLGADRQNVDLSRVAQRGKAGVRIIDIGDPARHARRKVASGLAQHGHYAAGHVFAAMIAAAFDHGNRARIADRKAFTRDAVEERLTGNRAIKHGVADDDVVRRLTVHMGRLAHDHAAARQALADIVVAVAGQVQGHPVGQPCAKALSGNPGQLDVDGVVRQPGMAIAPRHFARKHRADRAVDVDHPAFDHHGLLVVQRIGGGSD